MNTTQPLTDEQERVRLEGLRRLARIIARHALAQPAPSESAATTERPPGGEGTAGKDGAA